MPADHLVTQLLADVAAGKNGAEEQLVDVVYAELHRLAMGYMRKERPGHTLQASALVNEAYVRLIGERDVRWENRAHFYVTAARTMRRILIDHARSKQTAKRDGGHVVTLNEALLTIDSRIDRSSEMLMIDDALVRLERLDPRQCKIVELRFFGGLTVEETAQALDISPKTVKRDWSVARAWLEAELSHA